MASTCSSSHAPRGTLLMTPQARRDRDGRAPAQGARGDVGGARIRPFCEVDAETARAAYRSALESLNLTPEELLLGKVDETGDILWSGYPRWLSRHPGTLPTVEGIIEDIFGHEDPAPDQADNVDGNNGAHLEGQ